MATLFKPEPSFEELDRRQAFWARNRDRFLDQYADQFVAVKDGEVIIADPDLVRLLERLQAAGLKPGKDVWFKYITTKWNSLIL